MGTLSHFYTNVRNKFERDNLEGSIRNKNMQFFYPRILLLIMYTAENCTFAYNTFCSESWGNVHIAEK